MTTANQDLSSGRTAGKHLVIQVLCFNEAQTLPDVLASIPTSIPGIDRIDVLVVDDGSTDDTATVARNHGVKAIVQHHMNRGVAAAFQTGLETSIQLGADIIVNTDGDHQYPGSSIPQLIAPILARQADIVIGDRQTHQVAHFSSTKRALQQLGSKIVSIAAGTTIPDAASGFRALSREAALRIQVVSTYSYTIETIIQAAKKGLRIAHIPIEPNLPTRESRLIRSMSSYVRRQALTILRVYVVYEPFRTFTFVSAPFLIVGSILILRFLILYMLMATGVGRHVQSLVVGSMLLVVGMLIFLNGIIAHLVGANRTLMEESLYRQKRAAATTNRAIDDASSQPATESLSSVSAENTPHVVLRE